MSTRGAHGISPLRRTAGCVDDAIGVPSARSLELVAPMRPNRTNRTREAGLNTLAKCEELFA